MTNTETISKLIELLNALIVGVDTPTKVVTHCRRFRKAMTDYAETIKAEQMQINFDASTNGTATDADGNEIADVYTV